MTNPIQLWPLAQSKVTTAGVSAAIAFGPVLGGFLTNPQLPEDQGLATTQNLFYSMIGPAATSETGTTFLLAPGDTFEIPDGFSGTLWVNSNSSGHLFSGILYRSVGQNVPSQSAFPPNSPTVFTGLIPSYLYEEYNDDDDLQTFVAVFNEMAKSYVDWFVNVDLPFYPGLEGGLLDWIAAGLYGMVRPVLPSGRGQVVGPFNTVVYNTGEFNELRLEGASNYYLVNDDVFKRILTWHVYKGDGKQFDIRWLKRRVTRFLMGENGLSDTVGETYPVSVTFGTDGEVNINLQSIRRYATGGSMFNVSAYNAFAFNEFETIAVQFPVSPLAPIFKAAMDSGVLEVPFQFTFIVNID